MSDWQVGDLAVRVTGNPVHGVPGAPPRGLIIRVDRVRHGAASGMPALYFAKYPGPKDLGWAAGHFRKVRPDEREACEAEFVILLKRSRQLADVSTAQGVGDASGPGSRAAHGTSLPPSGLRSVSQGEDQ